MTTLTAQSLWRVLSKRYQLTPEQENQLQLYSRELRSYNELVNLTAITNTRDIIQLHFDDSLVLGTHVDLIKHTSVCDVGAGAGFPGIPLKIKYPHLTLYLVETNHKKIQFLEHVIRELALTNTQVCAQDWRTFLRTTNHHIDLFCSRAALEPTELVRMFKPSCIYNQAQMVYWAAESWQAPKHIASLIAHEYIYYIAGRKRRLVVFKKNSSPHSQEA